MNGQLHLVRRAGTVLVITALLAMSVGCSLAGPSRESGSDTGAVAPMRADSLALSPAPTGGSAESPAPQEGSKAASTVSPDRLIVSNSSMSVQVDDVDKAVAGVRTIATSSGSQVAELSVQTGDGGVGEPIPLDAKTSGSSGPASSAQIVLRVPAAKLASVEGQVAKLGKVLTQSASQSDVTQQHVDMSARLKNLQAEEARLRSFFDRATKVTEMLEIERELSRVRGEIESMQAQIAYLEQQAALATLSISLSAPGSLVQAPGGTWGFSEAITKGVQAAAALIGVIIFVAIMLLPIWVIVLVVVLVVRARRRRRAARAVAVGESGSDDPETPSVPPAE